MCEKEQFVFFSQLYSMLYYHALILCSKAGTQNADQKKMMGYGYLVNGSKYTLPSIALVLRTGRLPGMFLISFVFNYL
jgi:hypothetical protein